MAKYVVHMTATASLAVEVDVPDNAGPEDIIFEAFEQAPGDVCAQCIVGRIDFMDSPAAIRTHLNHGGEQR
jgi:hypothetical protein